MDFSTFTADLFHNNGSLICRVFDTGRAVMVIERLALNGMTLKTLDGTVLWSDLSERYSAAEYPEYAREMIALRWDDAAEKAAKLDEEIADLSGMLLVRFGRELNRGERGSVAYCRHGVALKGATCEHCDSAQRIRDNDARFLAKHFDAPAIAPAAISEQAPPFCSVCNDTGKVTVSYASAENGPTDDPADETGVEPCESCERGHAVWYAEAESHDRAEREFFASVDEPVMPDAGPIVTAETDGAYATEAEYYGACVDTYLAGVGPVGIDAEYHSTAIDDILARIDRAGIDPLNDREQHAGHADGVDASDEHDECYVCGSTGPISEMIGVLGLDQNVCRKCWAEWLSQQAAKDRAVIGLDAHVVRPSSLRSFDPAETAGEFRVEKPLTAAMVSQMFDAIDETRANTRFAGDGYLSGSEAAEFSPKG